jgi:hypothetical protein
MPFFIPLAVGGLALAALGLGVKRVLEEAPPPGVPDTPAVREARERHRQALAALRDTRLRTRDAVAAYGERQARAHAEVVAPFRALLERLERWEHAREADVLPAEALEVLRALPPEPPRAVRRPWALLGLGAPTPPALESVLAWLERGLLEEDAPPVVVDGTPLYEAAAPWAVRGAGSPEAWARVFDEAAQRLAGATGLLESLRAGLVELDARVARLHGRASAQLAYLDASSFDEGGPEPRERLVRLGALVGRLVLTLRLPVLGPDGRRVPLPPVPPGDEAPPQT